MSRTRTLILAAAALLLAAATAAARLGPGGTLAARPDRGVTPGGAYSVSNVDSVSLTGGGLRVSIPLASLPPIAGGKLGVTLTAVYDSKLWDVERHEVRVDGTVGRQTYVRDVPRQSERGGWRITGPTYGFFLRDASHDFSYDQPQQHETSESDWTWIKPEYQWKRAYLLLPDGAEHELVPDFPVVYYDGDFSLRPYLKGSFRFIPESGPHPRRYHTVDGSYLTVRALADGTWEVAAPDGTRVTQSADGQRITDPNGNSVRVYAAEDGTRYEDEQSGRYLRVKEVVGGREVGYQVAGGGWQHVSVNLGATRVQGKIYRINANPTVQSETGGPGQPCVHDAVLEQDVPVVRGIIFPTTEAGKSGRSYSFEYNSDDTEQFTTNYRDWCGEAPASRTFTSSMGLGELSKMTTPTGAVVEYDYSLDGAHRAQLNVDEFTRSLVKKKRVKHDDVTDEWTYAIHWNQAGGSVTNPDGTTHTESSHLADPGYGYQMGTASGLGGKAFRSESGNVRVERRWRSNPGGNFRAGPSGLVAVNPVVEAEYTSFVEGGAPVRMSAKTYEYDLNGNVTRTREYDWFDPPPPSGRDEAGIPLGVPLSATLLRETTTSYYNTAPDASSPNLYFRRAASGSTLVINAPREVAVAGGSVTKFSYDGQSFDTAPTRGNPTKVEQWDSATNAWLSTSATYDDYGNRETSTDANGNVTKYFYDDATHALPTRVRVDPLNGTGAQEATTTYDFHTGLVVKSKDANGNETDYDYHNHLLNAVDPLGRVGTVRAPADAANGNQRRAVRTYYEDAARVVRTEADLRTQDDGLLKTRTVSDKLGRVVLTQQNEGGVNYTVSTLAHHEQGGRVTYASNPRRGDVEAPTEDGWTRTTRDTAGRVVEVATFAGEGRPTAMKLCTAANDCTGTVTTAYYAEYLTVTDQAGKTRRSKTDALGRLVRVDEPGTSGSLGERNSPAQPTCYAYDGLGNLTRVRQGGQWQGDQCQNSPQPDRVFQYTTLSRLTSAANPESGTVSYEYDAAGNLKKKTDARKLPPGTQTSVETSYAYDGLNRVTSRAYNDGTPQVSFYYDSQALPPGAPAPAQAQALKGVLRAVVYGGQGSTTGTYYAYDGLGRITSSAQRTDAGSAGAQDYAMPEYRYDLSGNLTSQTYPLGRVVKSEYDAAGRLAGVRNGASGPFYAGGAAADSDNRIAYAAHGAVLAMRLANNDQLWEHTSFNSRLQPTHIGLGTSAADASKLSIGYTYGVAEGGALNVAKNNGNVESQTVTVPATGNTPKQIIKQSYEYDELNRLKVVREVNETTQCPTAAGTNDCWRQKFSYDQFGNRRFDQGETSWPAINQNNQNSTNPEISPTTNRLTGAGYGYDAAGNLLCDPQHPCGAAGVSAPYYTYDAENRLKSAAGGAQAGGAEYLYDGDGRRVRKQWGAQVTVFIYDAFGKLVAEYANTAPASNGTQYLAADHLGSPRIITDAAGNVKARHDYFPFGEEIGEAVGGRTTQQGYSQSDSVRQKFTSKERDDETGLDYFLARYYSPQQGRFTSPDEFTGGPDELFVFADAAAANPTFYADITEPQTLNKYQYCLNSPLRYVDPDGHQQKETLKRRMERWLYSLFKETVKNDMSSPDQTNVPKEDRIGPLGSDAHKISGRSTILFGQGMNILSETLVAIDPTGGSGVVKSAIEGKKTDTALAAGGMVTNKFGSNIALREAKRLVGAWGIGSFRHTKELIRHSFERHGHQVGAKNVGEFLRKAAGFNTKGAQRTYLEDGGILFTRKDGTFLIKDKNNKIVSYGRNE